MSEAPVIRCENVWKVFGNDPKKYLASMPEGRSFDDIRADGYIAGVRDVSIQVARGEMLVIMGLSGSRLLCFFHKRIRSRFSGDWPSSL